MYLVQNITGSVVHVDSEVLQPGRNFATERLSNDVLQGIQLGRLRAEVLNEERKVDVFEPPAKTEKEKETAPKSASSSQVTLHNFKHPFAVTNNGPTRLTFSNASRLRLIVRNTGKKPVFLGGENVSALAGYHERVMPGSRFIVDNKMCTAAWFAVTEEGLGEVAVSTVYNKEEAAVC